jgi:hypothetical protein
VSIETHAPEQHACPSPQAVSSAWFAYWQALFSPHEPILQICGGHSGHCTVPPQPSPIAPQALAGQVVIGVQQRCWKQTAPLAQHDPLQQAPVSLQLDPSG